MGPGVGDIVFGCLARSGKQNSGRCGNGVTERIRSIRDSMFTDSRKVRYLIRFAALVNASRSSGGTARTKASRAVKGTNSSPGTFARTEVAAS